MVLRRNAQDKIEAIPAVYTYLLEKVWLSPLEPASRRTYAEFLKHLKARLQTAFTTKNICQGWKKSGLCPLNLTQIMKRCASFRKLEKNQSRALLGAIPKVAEIASLRGETREEELQAAVGKAINFEDWLAAQAHVDGKAAATDGHVLHHRRAIWINHEAVTEKRNEEAQRKADVAARKEADKEERKRQSDEKDARTAQSKAKRQKKQAQTIAKAKEKLAQRARHIAALHRRVKGKRAPRARELGDDFLVE
jgi:hypothetical protein